jgi:WD40 repeat protein
MTTPRQTLSLASLAALTLLACTPETVHQLVGLQADRFSDAEWSEPVNLGPVVNTSANDANAGLSPDGHTLYFVSDRPGGLGGLDIWATERRCIECPWEAPVNLGAPVNSPAGEGAPTVSDNGRQLFFFSGRPGGGGLDIYVSHLGDDGWGDPVNLGPDVNTALAEQGPYYVREPAAPTAVVYFNRPAGTSTDIFRVAVTNDGTTLGPAVLVPEISDPATFDQKVAVRTDGHELLLSSPRAGTFGGFDIWVSTRQTPQDPWSTPSHLDGPVNTPNIDSQPSLSRDGRTLIFTSNRPGGSGLNDLWMATRSAGGN